MIVVEMCLPYRVFFFDKKSEKIHCLPKKFWAFIWLHFARPKIELLTKKLMIK